MERATPPSGHTMPDSSLRHARSTADAAARCLTELGAPWVVNIAGSLVFGAGIGAPGWGIFVALVAGAIPMGIILAGMQRARIADRHVTRVDERHALVAAILAVVVAGLIVALAGDAPIEIVAFFAAGLVTLAVAGIVTRLAHWKVSVHTGVGAGMSVVLASALSSWWLLGLVFTAAVGWSRVRLGDHTRGQVVVGAIVGVVSAGATYLLLV